MSTSTILSPPLPRLRHGERLSRDEFQRRYEAMSDVKAELLDGVVYIVSSPVSEYHGNPHADLVTWMGFYRAYTPGIVNGDNTTLRLPVDADAQPDGYLRIAESHGGRTCLDESGYVIGAPDLIGEVAYSSLAYDKSVKRPIYQREKVREFILWRVEERIIDWYALHGESYDELSVDPSGIIRSEIFPGLWLDVTAMVRGDLAKVLEVLQQGIATEAHAEFVRKLQTAAG